MRLVLIALLLAPTARALAEGTDNHVLVAVPAPGAVAIDGDLAEWDRSRAITVAPDLALVGSCGASVAAMYDADALYLGVAWRDATPMVNDYAPDLDLDRRKCFHSDSLQLHVRTDVERKVIGWWYRRGSVAAAIGLDGWFPWDTQPIAYHDAVAEYAVREAFALAGDGAGYVQELRIPWRAITAGGRAYHGGESFEAMLDLVWGPDSGKGWPAAHLMDLVAPGAAHAGWFWEVPRIYGRIEFSERGAGAGAAPPAAPVAARPVQAEGGITLRATLPDADAEAFSLALEDEHGQRVRALIGARRVVEQRVGDHVEQAWDGLDDRGRLVEPGTYRVVGLSRRALTATYEQCFDNPGTPPWPTADGTGGWGGDHTPPGCVATAGDDVIIGWGGAEGGFGVIAVGADGRKRWGAPPCARALAARGDEVLVWLDDSWSGQRGLGRLARADGAYRPWTIAGRAVMPYDLAAALRLPAGIPAHGLAVDDARIVVALGDELIALARDDLRVVARATLPGVAQPAFAPDGTLWALVGGKPCRVDLAAGRATPLAGDAIARGTALTIAPDGELIVADMGPDAQIKALGADGVVHRAIGTRGGRALRGAYDATTLEAVAGVAIDARGRCWAAEDSECPRRVSVWTRDGALAREYVGNAAYAACGTYLHDQDPTLAYAGCVEFVRDPAARTATPIGILWRPDGARGERFGFGGGLAAAQRFTSVASGTAREYGFTRPDWGGEPLVLFMRRAQGWKPVASIALVGQLSGGIGNGVATAMPDGTFAGCDPFDGAVWSDANGDGIATRDECEIVPAQRAAGKVGAGGSGPLPMSCGWGSHPGDDLTIWVDGVCAWHPIGFDADGAPRYGMKGLERTPLDDRGDLVPLDREKRLVVLSSTGYGGDSYVRGVEYGTWRELWRYPSRWHGVHGSHHAPLVEPGVIVGALKAIGVATMDDGVGVVAIRGNLGQDFLIGSDGLYVGELFSDCRRPCPSLPRDETSLVGQRVDDRSEGGEPFSGWFGRQRDGVVRIATSLAGPAALVAQVHGLETIRRFRGEPFTVTAGDLARCERLRALAAARPATRPRARVVAFTPRVDGDPGEWKDVPEQRIERASHATFKLAYDRDRLSALFVVDDATPWRNAAPDAGTLFKTGDAVDLQIAVAAGDADAPTAIHRRLVIAPMGDHAVCVLMRPVDPDAPAALARVYKSPVGERRFARVETLAGADVAVRVEDQRYVVELSVPLAALGLAPAPGLVVRGDAGVIASDADGTRDVARSYWADPATNLVNDLPGEAWLEPAAWGEFAFE